VCRWSFGDDIFILSWNMRGIFDYMLRNREKIYLLLYSRLGGVGYRIGGSVCEVIRRRLKCGGNGGHWAGG
jgi:hypothetical protein